MKYSIQKNWSESFELIVKNPILLMPFVIAAFIETLVLEFVYFSTRFPLSPIMAPIIRKFFGEPFVHYPGNLVVLPGLFYYIQMIIYILFGAFLAGVSVNMFRKIKTGLPLKTKAIAKNTFTRYISFVLYATVITVALFFTRKLSGFLFAKIAVMASKFMPKIPQAAYAIAFTFLIFISVVIVYSIFLLTIPAIIIEKKSFLKALWRSIALAFRNFLSFFPLILLPFLLYLPLTVLKTFSGALTDKISPEVNLYIALLGIIITIFIDCFIFICASQFLFDKLSAEDRAKTIKED